MRKIILSWCFVLLFCPGVSYAEDEPDYIFYLSNFESYFQDNNYYLSSISDDFASLRLYHEEIWNAWFETYLPYIQQIGDDFRELKPTLNEFFDSSSQLFEKFDTRLFPQLDEISDSSSSIADDVSVIREDVSWIFQTLNPFTAVAIDKFYDRVTFDSDSLLVTDIELRNKVTDSNQELQTMNGSLSEVLVQLSQIYNMIHNLVDPVTQISNIQDILQQLLDIGVGGGDSTNDIANVLAEWGYQDYGEDYKEAKDNLNSAGEDLNFTIVGYDETTATIETNMHTRSFGRTVSKDNWFEQVQDFLLIIAKASQSQAMSGQLNYLINYENYKSQKDADKEKKEYEDRISELEQQVGELNQSFSDLEDLITYFSQPSEKKEVFTKFQTELQNIRLISNELPQYIKLGEFPASWQNISIGGDLSININDLHPFFRSCNSVFGFIYYSLITLFLIWLFSKVPSIIKPLLSLVKNIMTWK